MIARRIGGQKPARTACVINLSASKANNTLRCCCAEQITLMSRDEASLLVVSYADLKRCLEGALGELRTRGLNSRPQIRLDARRR